MRARRPAHAHTNPNRPRQQASGERCSRGPPWPQGRPRNPERRSYPSPSAVGEGPGMRANRPAHAPEAKRGPYPVCPSGRPSTLAHANRGRGETASPPSCESRLLATSTPRSRHTVDSPPTAGLHCAPRRRASFSSIGAGRRDRLIHRWSRLSFIAAATRARLYCRKSPANPIANSTKFRPVRFVMSR